MIPKEITAFYNRYKTRLYNTSLRITGDSFDAEEIVQDTIIKYLRTNTAKLTEAQTSAWLTKACTRASIDMLRMRRGHMRRKTLRRTRRSSGTVSCRVRARRK